MSSITQFKGRYRFLSNFWNAPVMFDGTLYATLEHAYQAAKTHDAAGRRMISLAQTPGYAKRLGRTVRIRSDWEKAKLGVMEDLVRDKFTRHPVLGKWLVDTSPRMLIEGNSWGDTYWGVCGGVGENHLGHILMKIRSELING